MQTRNFFFFSKFTVHKTTCKRVFFTPKSACYSNNNITHANWKFFQFSKQEQQHTKIQHTIHVLSRFNLHQNYGFRHQKCPENTPRFVPNYFEPAPMLGLSSMAIEWPLNKGIPSRRRTYLLECKPTHPLFLPFLFLSFFFSYFLSFFLFFLSFFPSLPTKLISPST